MDLYLDSANLAEIEELASYGIIDGITTNPSLVKQGAGELREFVLSICRHVSTSVSVEVVATEAVKMVEEGRWLAAISPAVTVKVPMTWEGLKATKILAAEGTRVNVTLCFTPTQALLAAKAGATYVSPFIGRLDDIGEDGIALVEDIQALFSNYPNIRTKILGASVRNLHHLRQLALIGVDVATAPYSVIKQMMEHPLTDLGLKRFLADAQKSGYKIG